LLQEKGVKPDTIVGLMLERSLEMIIGLLGILKAGGAYLPIDPEYPQERIDYMLKDSGAKILVNEEFLNHSVLRNSPLERGASSLHLKSAGGGGVCLNPQPAANPSNLSYIIYTSGSTGRPKGVMVDHKNLVNYVQAFKQEFEITFADTMLQQASYTFDAFSEEVYPVLLSGGTLAIPAKNEIMDIDIARGYLNRPGINRGEDLY
jgi:non-ribosomal peptide synthetase component F